MLARQSSDPVLAAHYVPSPQSGVDPERPVLDLACGYGHTLHLLTAGPAPREAGEAAPAVGVDQNFHQAWVGQHWVAPAARFVCADADALLPFVGGAFGSALCVDAFHYLHDKASAVAELQRLTAGGTVVLARVGNVRLEPHEGEELAPEAYRDLFGPWPSRWFGEDALVDATLSREAPDLAAADDPSRLAGCKWLYGVAAETEAALAFGPPEGGRPHTTGALALNPLYEAREDGTSARLRFPSPWYAFRNARMAEYHVPTATLGADTLGDLAAGRRTDRLARLADRFVVIGCRPGTPGRRAARGPSGRTAPSHSRPRVSGGATSAKRHVPLPFPTRVLPAVTAMLRTALVVAALALSACRGETDAPEPPPAAARIEGGVQTAEIAVGAEGYEPASVALRAGVPARLVFTRTTDDTCGKTVHSEVLGIPETRLPLGQSVPIEFTPDEAGQFTFACGMDMMEGTVVIRS